MPAGLHLAIEVAHWGTLVPLGYLLLWRRSAPPGYWACALAFSVSWFADLVAALTGGSWVAVPWYLAVQWLLFGAAVPWRELWPAVGTYCVLGTVFYLGMLEWRSAETQAEFMRWWWPYQASRLGAFGLFLRTAWRMA